MRSILMQRFLSHVLVFAAFALTVPFLIGCSTLGIATLDDLSATETSIQNTNNSTATRIDELEREQTEMQQTLTQVTTSLDTLNSRFERAAVWLQNMNLDTISADAQKAQEAAMGAEARAVAFLTHYIEWMKAQQTLLQEQIMLLEAKMAPPAEGDGGDASPAESGDDESSGDSGG